MGRILHLLFMLSCIATLSSCKEMALSKQVKEFMDKTIVMPDSLLVVKGGDIAMKESNKLTHPTLIVYIDENSCTSCKISHLIDYTPLFEKAKENQKFDVMIIFSPKEDDYNKVKKELILRGFEYPVYLDRKREFIKLNSDAISSKDVRFNSFLLNSSYKPIYIGDPMTSDKLWNIFLQILETIDKQ